MYISSYWRTNQISTVQSERTTCVGPPVKISPKSQVNEPGNAVLRKLCEPEKLVAPSGTKPPPGSYCCAKSTKNSIFVNQNTTHLWCGAWQPIWCREAVLAPANLASFTTTLISFNLRLKRLYSHVYVHDPFLKLPISKIPLTFSL